MIFKGKKISFPAVTQLSFFKVIESLEKLASDDDPGIAGFARQLLDDCAKKPELVTGIDRENFDPNQDIIHRLCRVLFPDVLLTNEIKAVMPPFEFKPFYFSTRFKHILEASEDDFSIELNDFSEDRLYIYGCVAIMGSYYHYTFPSNIPTFVDIRNKKLNSVRTYRMAMNGELLEVVPTDKAKEISKQDYEELLDNFDDIQLWKEKFPPNSWIMRGIGITNLMDVTIDNSLATITSNLLSKSSSSVENIHNGMRNLFGIKDLSIGFLTYENHTFYSHKKSGMGSMMLGGEAKLECEGNVCHHTYDTLVNKLEPLVISDIDRFDKQSNSHMSHMLKRKPIKSYIIAPIRNGEEFYGYLELSSPRKYELSGASLPILEEVMPILSMAISRFKREEQNRIEAIIQQECTTIHSSVKWRFEEEAQKFIQWQSTESQPIFRDIVFKNVYPLYGQLDIRGSSEKRNQAVKADLSRQLYQVSQLLVLASQKTSMPIFEQLQFRVDSFKAELEDELLTGSEHRIINFLETEVHPTLVELKKRDKEIEERIDAYNQLIHPELHSIYDHRKKYDQSVNTINQALASFLDEKQVGAQAMFPHYFERYKTDGVEYNIYIGQSIAKNSQFDPMYLHNLQLWQLITTCDLENRFVEVKSGLQSDIEIASLILVYNTPLSVHFRMDEKRFDVEGAYNARYEIVKKRIDKANIKGTEERITQPGKIAIIYSNEEDARLYKRYIEFLENKGYLIENSLESFEIENLQGITGLRALRVTVNYNQDLSNTSFDINEILEGVKNS